MLIKRIAGATLSEAMDNVAKNCGQDALVFSTEQTSSGYVIFAARPTDDGVRKKPRPTASKQRWRKGFRRVAEHGEDFGLSERILAAIEEALTGTTVSLQTEGDPAMPSLCTKVLAALIKTPPAGVELPPQRICALVGPTGVGKTTTLAKLAARATRHHDESVAIISLDTYRVAAVEQMRAFADMMQLPFTVAFTPQDLRQAVADHQDRDRVLIDTTGRGPFDTESIEMLRATLASAESCNVLCLPANLRRQDAEATLQAYKGCRPQQTIMTKWDETRTPGDCLSVLIERGFCLSHITVGQEIPDDLVVAEPSTLAAAALGLQEHEFEAVS